MLNHVIELDRLYTIFPRQELANQVVARLSNYELTRPLSGLHDEQVWTLLFAYGFIAGDVEEGRALLANQLIEGTVPVSPFRVWLEMLPLPPRQGNRGLSERNSNIDLIAGHQRIRGETAAGVEYEKPESGLGWVCMTEAKWLYDIAGKTTHDFHRNQLARVIETALTFQRPGYPPSYPDAVHVTLLTPARFKPPTGSDTGSRLYFYTFNEYQHPTDGLQVSRILADIDSAEVAHRIDNDGWLYPVIRERMRSLSLHWVTYEQLLRSMPDSRFKWELADLLVREPRKVLIAT
jgi:hypothetical protein